MSTPPTRVLIADDDESMRWVLVRHLEAQTRRRYLVDQAADGRAAIEALAANPYDLVLLDIRMPPPTGLEILARLKQSEALTHNRDAVALVMTAQNTMANAIEAMRLGAFDYLTKPFDLEALTMIAERALESQSQTREIRRLRTRIETQQAEESGDMAPIGRSPAMQGIFKAIGRIAARPVNVLITGESGTGKEVIARAIHQSGVASAPFVPINMAAIPKDLMESELFGYEKGAFTGATESRPGKFEQATGGTLFLDEVGEMSLDLQAKLLRVLEEGVVYPLGSKRPVPVSPRLIAATNRLLEENVKKGLFREDLYYRLNVFPIQLPPLRERREDILPLAESFLARYAREYGIPAKMLDPAASALLSTHAWPGNVRELENTIKRALLIAEGPYLTSAEFPGLSGESSSGVEGAAAGAEDALENVVARHLARVLEGVDIDSFNDLYTMILHRIERPLIRLLLQKTKGNQIQAARVLGINRNTLRKKIHDLDIAVARGKGTL